MAELDIKKMDTPDEQSSKARSSRSEIGPGDAAHIAPGHDAWTVGDEARVAVDFGGSSNYAKRQ